MRKSATKGKYWQAIKKLSFPIKLVITLVVCWILYDQVFVEQDSDIKLGLLITDTLTDPLKKWLFALCMLLMPVNWYMETLKWHLLANKITKVKFYKSLFGTMSGLSLSSIFPNRTGEFAGRILYMPAGTRIKGVIASFVAGWAQLAVTLITGGTAGIFFAWYYLEQGNKLLVIMMLLAILIFTLLLFFNIHRVGKIEFSSEKARKILKPLKVLNLYPVPFLRKIFTLSLVRYSVFSAQFYMLLNVFEVNITQIQSLLFIPLSFFLNTLVPSITIAELGIRELINLQLINQLSPSDHGVVFASFSLWFINIVIPSLIGVFFILGAKLFPSK